MEHPSTTQLLYLGWGKAVFHSWFLCNWSHPSFPWPGVVVPSSLQWNNRKYPFSSTMDNYLKVRIGFVILQTRWVELMPKSSILVSFEHSNFSQSSYGSFRCLIANFRQFWRCPRGVMVKAMDYGIVVRGQIELNCVLMLKGIAWNRRVFTFNCE